MTSRWPVERIPALILAALLLLPVLVLIARTDHVNFSGVRDWMPVLAMTLLQASVSALMSLVFGGAGALGLMSTTSAGFRRWFRMLALLPCFLPPLLVLSSLFLWTDMLALELRGLWAVVFVHVIINAGVCAVAIADLIDDKLGAMSNVSLVLGAGRWKFYREILLPVLKWDFLYLYTMVFAICVTSFSIPLIVGDARISLEVLIYESMKISKDWNQALAMTLVQLLVIFVLFFPLHRSTVHQVTRKATIPGYGWMPGLAVILLASALAGMGLVWGVAQGLRVWASVSADFTPEFFRALSGTVRITLMAALFVFAFLNVVVINVESGSLHKLLSGYLAPSPVIVGFSLWSLSSNSYWMSEVKMALGLALVFLPALYRWRAASVVLALRGQVQAARSMGAGTFYVFRRITFPQTVKATSWLAGVAAFWASGDFVLASILGFGHSTLGLLAESLIGSYQFELASLISLIIFAFGGCCLVVLGGLGRVLDSKPLP